MKLLFLPMLLVSFMGHSDLKITHQTETNTPTASTLTEIQYFLQFYVSGVEDLNHQKRVQTFLAAKQGVFMARMDRTTRICFMILHPGQDLSENLIDKELEEMGYHISCFRKAVYGVDKPYTKENFQCN